MAIYRNAQGDAIDVPDSLAEFIGKRGYKPDTELQDAAPAEQDSEQGSEPPSDGATTDPAVPNTDPTEGDNDSEGVTNNG